MKKPILLCILLITMICPETVYCGEKDSTYSVKHRWVVKVSATAYRTMLPDMSDFFVGFYETDEGLKEQGLNMRFEGSYAFGNCIEIGLFAGFQCYRYGFVDDNGIDVGVFFATLKKATSPLFGINVNFQLLPLFLKTATCRWDMYLTANYSGCIIRHPYLIELSTCSPPAKYRHAYGFGMGLAYYFKNRAGLFGEVCVGNFSFFPDYSISNVNFRGGITTKF